MAKLLGALGVSPAREVAVLRPAIIRSLVEVLGDPFSEQKVKWGNWKSKGTLKETLYEDLLRVAGWL